MRALERFPAQIETVSVHERSARLLALARDPELAWIGIVDTDVLLRADAFGALRSWLDTGPAVVGGRALTGNMQRLGAMLAPPRSGPDPFELVPLVAPRTDRWFPDAVRGAIDVPQRGVLIAATNFLRALGAHELTAEGLFLDLAVHARALGRAVICEPSLTFDADADDAAHGRALGRFGRYRGIGSWRPAELHRDPPGLRRRFINREIRTMGDVRGYERRPMPPIDVLVTAEDDVGRARGMRDARALRGGGAVTAIVAADGDALRAALARTGERYLLVATAMALPARAALDALVERLETTSGCGIALDRGHDVALFHLGRVVNGGALGSATVADVIAYAVNHFPERRIFAVDADGAIVPDALPGLSSLGSVDIVLVAASRPEVTGQTLQAVMKERVKGVRTVIYPAGAGTTERLLRTYTGLTLVADASDPHLAVELNRTLASAAAEGVLIVRDDVQLPLGCIPHLQDAFRRIPRLGIAVPRVGGTGRPEALPDLGYRNSGDMQAFSDRRGEEFAREAMVIDIATTPVLLTTREVLDVVGGFDERFAFSRIGVEDFARRVRAANFRTVRCDDAYAHLFPPDEAVSFLASIDDDPALRAAAEQRWASVSGFDPERDRVAFRAASSMAGVPPSGGVRVLVPVSTVEEWKRVVPLLADLAAAFRAHDPLTVVVGLDGGFGLQTAVSLMREVLAATRVPLEETLNIRIEQVRDLAAWRNAAANSVRVAAVERAELATLPIVDGVSGARVMMAESGR